jgi:hypothetical protein
MSVNPETFMQWTAREFYHLVRFHAWRSSGENEYRKIMGAKK